MSGDHIAHGLPDDLQRTRPYDLGVMLVHGIGQQRRGDTLESNGGALLESIRSYVEGWLGDDVDARVSVERTSVGDSSGPEYFVANIDITQGPVRNGPLAVSQRRRWLIAESHWADVFPAPSYGEIADWVLNVLPVVAAVHFGRRVRRALAQFRNPDSHDNGFRRGWQVVLRVGGAGVAAALVPPLMLVLLALLAFGLLPLPFVKEPARLAQRLLAGSVGDSYVLLERAVSTARIVDRVRRDMCWLGDRCERVAMVAHSQGGAVAHEVARSNPRMPCDLLLTYGSGLRKLAMLKRYLLGAKASEEDATTVRGTAPPNGLARQGVELWVAMALLFVPWAAQIGHLLFAGGTQYLVSTTKSSPLALLPSPPLLLLSLACWLMGIFVIKRWARHLGAGVESGEQMAIDKQLFHEQYELINANTRWLDVYSTHDPVPNGPLLEEYDPDTLETHEVTLFGSLLTDHTGYWESKDDFLLGLTRELFALDVGAPREKVDGAVTPALRAWAARLRRRLRVAWTTLSAVAAGLFAALALPRLWTDPPELYIRLALNVAEIVRSVPLIGVPLVGTAEDPHHRLLAMVATILLASVGYLMLTRLWGLWDAEESSRAVNCALPAAPSPLPWRLAVYILAATLIVAAGVFLWLGVWGAVVLFGVIALALAAVQVAKDRPDMRAWLNRHCAGGPPGALAVALDRQAAANFRKLVDSKQRKAQYTQGRRLLESADPDVREKGRALLEASLDKGYQHAGYSLGDYLEKRCRDYRGAAKAFAKAGELGDAYCKVRHAQLLIGRLDERERGEAVLLDAAERHGEEYAYSVLADQLSGRNDKQRAREVLRAFVEGTVSGAAPSERRRQSRYCAWRLADLAENADETLSALSIAFESGEVRAATKLADEYLRRGEHAEAIEVLRDGVALRCAESALRLGELLNEEGDAPGAVAAWRRGVELATRRQAAHGDAAPADQAMRHGAAAAAGLAALSQQCGRPLTSRRVADKGFGLAEQAMLLAPEIAPGRTALQEHAGVQRLALERSAAAYARGDEASAEVAARVALAFGSVDAGLLLVERCRFDHPGQAEAYARRAVALETRWQSLIDEAPAHRMLSGLLEQRDIAREESVSLLRIAAMRGDGKAVHRIVDWLGMLGVDGAGAFPDLGGLVADVGERWTVPYHRLAFVKALLAYPLSRERLQQAAGIVELTWCHTQAEKTVQRHLTDLVAEQLAQGRE